MNIIMMPYKRTSKGGKMLAEALKVQQVCTDEAFDPEEPTTVLNWGRGDFPRWEGNVVKFINDPAAVLRAIEKKNALRAFKRAGVPCPEFSTDLNTAKAWIREGNIVFCRTKTQGKDADGLVVARKVEDLVEATLYTKYKRKLNEYRIHVMNGEAFYANIKKKKAANRIPPNASPFVRSGSHGWFFVHLDNLPSKALCDASIAAVAALGLDFGGVDIGESEDGTVAVYEVNTAPEMGPNSTAAYKKALKKHYGQYKNNENVPLVAV